MAHDIFHLLLIFDLIIKNTGSYIFHKRKNMLLIINNYSFVEDFNKESHFFRIVKRHLLLFLNTVLILRTLLHHHLIMGDQLLGERNFVNGQRIFVQNFINLTVFKILNWVHKALGFLIRLIYLFNQLVLYLILWFLQENILKQLFIFDLLNILDFFF